MSKTCGKCGGSMAQGYIPEVKDERISIENWCEGEPKKGFLGLVTHGSRQLEIQTWRCGSCGYLESYAPA